MSKKKHTGTEAFQSKGIEVNLDQLIIDQNLQSRVEIDQALVAEYAEEMGGGAQFPPVIVFFDGTNHLLVDGFHRVLAAKVAGQLTIAAIVRSGSAREALLFAAGVNREHGLRRSNADKRKSVLILLSDPVWGTWSDRAIAEHCGVSHVFVGTMRSAPSGNDCQIERTVVRNGVEYSMDTSRIGKDQKASDNGTNANLSVSENLHNDDDAIKSPGLKSESGSDSNIRVNSDREADSAEGGLSTLPAGPVVPGTVASPADWAKQTWIPVKGSIADDISRAVLVVVPGNTPVNKELQSFLSRAEKLGFSVYMTPELQDHVAKPNLSTQSEVVEARVEAETVSVKRRSRRESPVDGDLW